MNSFVSRLVNKPSLVDSHYLYFICFTYSELNIDIQILKQTLLSLKCMKKTEQIVAIENAKLKLLKLLSRNNNALCNSSKLFYQHLTLERFTLC